MKKAAFFVFLPTSAFLCIAPWFVYAFTSKLREDLKEPACSGPAADAAVSLLGAAPALSAVSGALTFVTAVLFITSPMVLHNRLFFILEADKSPKIAHFLLIIRFLCSTVALAATLLLAGAIGTGAFEDANERLSDAPVACTYREDSFSNSVGLAWGAVGGHVLLAAVGHLIEFRKSPKDVTR